MQIVSACLLLCAALLIGCDPPESASAAEETGYYAGISLDSTGSALKAQLHDLIDDHEPLNYRELWDALAFTDEDPDNPGYVVLIYTGWSLPADAHGNDPSGWNREHVWSKSRGDFGTRQGAGTDLHAIRPAEVTVNTARANKAFDEGGEPYTDRDGPTGCRRDRDSWEPRPEVRGDVARMLFYMAVRYEDAELDLELTEHTPGQSDKAPAHGVLSTLLRWHAQDPPDDAERERNDRIQAVQGNRNPFIDRPELVERLWGG
ncbi:MAG: endonuclease [Planctomycetota bacterium]